MHHLAPSAILVFSLLAHSRAIGAWVRDRSRQRLNCAVLRELARTGGTVREEHRSAGGRSLVWELRLPQSRAVAAPGLRAARAERVHRPRRRRPSCGAATVRLSGNHADPGEAGGGR